MLVWCVLGNGGGCVDTVDTNEAAQLREQIAYYRARATEYDEWFLRLGRYDHGEEQNRQWFGEVAEVERALMQFAPRGRVLELACGTGWWTEQLVRYADQVTAVDASSEVIALNQAKLGLRENVHYQQADLFTWQPAHTYDVVFFSFWLSHVPPAHVDAFWEMVRRCLRPGGRVFFIDSLFSETSSASGHHQEGAAAVTTIRRLNDGRDYRIFKVFYHPEELEAQLASLGWRAEVTYTTEYFLYGSVTLR
jgi:2-polyprenyl-3-methyl-5-hydroxy-6-metoxy-1,4-benzoquinol methylase